MLDTGYVNHGIRNFWFDASEPESLMYTYYHNAAWIWTSHSALQPNSSLFAAGSNQQVGMMFPW